MWLSTIADVPRSIASRTWMALAVAAPRSPRPNSPRRLLLAIAAFALVSCTATAKAAEQVDLELVLAVDVSGSIDGQEARLQRDGYIAAITDDRVLAAIRSGRLGRIAVIYFEWGSTGQQRVLVPWTVVSSESSAAAFASALAVAPRTLVADRTSISGAITFTLPMFATNDFEAPRQVIDISGDGPNNSGDRVDAARNLAVSMGITINGLPVVNDRPNRFGLPGIPDLDAYYEACVIGGPGSFLVVAEDFEDFAGAILRKFILEIAAAPPPKQSAPVHLHTISETESAICGVGERRFKEYFGK